ncbi:hypothetical protein RSAG8_03704, partial [Rhizoctonia solani AG-8 WAC10335]
MDLNTPTPSPPIDQNNPTFDPRPPSRRGTRSNLSVQSAPKTDISGGSYVSDSVKKELKLLAPDGKRCLVTRNVEQIDCCQVIARPTPVATLKKLEIAWGITNKDLRLNQKVLNKICTFEVRRAGGPSSSHYLEKFADTEWDYHFVPFRRSPIRFHRYDDSLQGYPNHDYPFATLGLLRSHVHPFFAVYNAGEKALYHQEKKKEPNSDTDIPPEFEEPLGVCVKIFNLWNKEVPEALQPDVSSQAPRNPSHPPSTSEGRSGEGSRQHDREWDERAKHRHITPASPNPRQSDLGIGTPQGRDRMATASATDQYLSTPESIHSGVHDNCLGIICSGNSLPSCHWTSVDDWVAGVESSAPCKYPHQGGTEHTEQSLVQYSYEEVRCPPGGSWERWIPEGVLLIYVLLQCQVVLCTSSRKSCVSYLAREPFICNNLADNVSYVVNTDWDSWLALEPSYA